MGFEKPTYNVSGPHVTGVVILPTPSNNQPVTKGVRRQKSLVRESNLSIATADQKAFPRKNGQGI